MTDWDPERKIDTAGPDERAGIVPQPVAPGGRIGIVAPSGAVPRDRFERGVAVLRSMGYTPVFGDEVFARQRYLAGEDRQRAEALHRCFGDETIDAVICARGGYGTLRLLPYLDLEMIRHHPKPFIGFSDISVLHWVFYRCCGMATYHGPVITSLGEAGRADRESLMTAIGSRRPICLNGIHRLKDGTGVGPVVGGNLSTLSHLLGTPVAPQFRGCILLLEDTKEPAYKIDRMLSQMALSGCFDGLSGLVLGTFTDCGPMAAIQDLVMEVFEGKNIPIMAGVAVGHGPANRTIPLGMTAILQSDAMRLTVDRTRSPDG